MRRIWTILVLSFLSGNVGAECKAFSDPQELMVEYFNRADVVFLANEPVWGSEDFTLVSVKNIWKGELADKAQVIFGHWESPPRDTDFVVFANSKPDGYSSYGRCFRSAVEIEARKLKLTEKELMTQLFGEPHPPNWNASVAITYLAYFFAIAALFGVSAIVASWVSPNRAFKSAPSGPDAATLRRLT